MSENTAEDQSWKVGILFSQTGVTSIVELTLLKGALLAIDEINAQGGVAGKSLEPVIYDPESDPDKYAFFAKKLLSQDKVKTVFGCYMSSCRKAVLPEVERRGGLLFYPTFYEGFEYSPNCIYSGAAPNQACIQLTHFLRETYGENFYLVGSNYVFPRETNRVISDMHSQLGGKVLAERYIPVNATQRHIDLVIEDIKKKQPDVIFSSIVGTPNLLFYKAYRQAGFKPSLMPIASLITSEAEIQLIGHDNASGHISAGTYFEGIDTPKSYQFTKAFKRRFGEGESISSSAEAAYLQVNLFAQALERAGNDETESILSELIKVTYDAPQGKVHIDPDNHHTYLWSRVAKVNKDGKFTIVSESQSAVKPDPYFISLNINN